MSLQMDRRGIWNLMGPCVFAFVIMASMWVRNRPYRLLFRLREKRARPLIPVTLGGLQNSISVQSQKQLPIGPQSGCVP